VSRDDGQVSFRYQDSDSGQWRTLTWPALEFIRRFLQHVLPNGFIKVRYYGFLELQPPPIPANPPRPFGSHSCEAFPRSASRPRGHRTVSGPARYSPLSALWPGHDLARKTLPGPEGSAMKNPLPSPSARIVDRCEKSFAPTSRDSPALSPVDHSRSSAGYPRKMPQASRSLRLTPRDPPFSARNQSLRLPNRPGPSKASSIQIPKGRPVRG
jgi:Putative transposase